MTRAGLSSSELEFLAEDTLVSVRLTAGASLGPFRPGVPVSVPLWAAVALRRRAQCRLEVPDWLTAAALERSLDTERKALREFVDLPFHWLEIGTLLMQHFAEEIPDVHRVRALMADLHAVRQSKIMEGLGRLTARRNAVKLANLSAMEINLIRLFLVKSLRRFYMLDKPDEAEAATPNNRTPPPAQVNG
eukprot:jgi/Chlat1/1578/Chrsp123S01852